MSLMYSLLTFILVAGASGQFFDRPMLQFGFDFPDFDGPDAFEEGPFMGLNGIRERMAELKQGQLKPRPGVKTKVKTKHEGNTNITEIEQKGKGYKSWAKLTTFEDGNKTGEQSFTKMISGLFGGSQAGSQAEEKSKKSECSGNKPCKGDNYCDPIEGVCKPRLPIGAACYFKDQCKKENDAICIWGKCSTGRIGQPGTFCKKDKDCIADSYCGEDMQFSMFHPICKPKLSEGATCGSANPGGVFKVLIGKRSLPEDEKKNPCKDGLKCEIVGFLGGMVCVPENLVTKPVKVKGQQEDEELEEADKEATSSGQDTDEKEDNNEGGDIVPSKDQKNPEEQKPVAEEGEDDEQDDNSKQDSNDGDEETTNEQEGKQNGGKKPPVVNPGKLPTSPGRQPSNNQGNLPYPPPAKKGKKKIRKDREHKEDAKED